MKNNLKHSPQNCVKVIMSDIKFSCSACGQHIVCDAESSGQKTACPTCRWDITIPFATERPTAFVQRAASVPPPLPQLQRAAPTAPVKTDGQGLAVESKPKLEDLAESFQSTMQVLGALGIGVGVINLVVSFFLSAGKLPTPDGLAQEMMSILGFLAVLSGALYLASGVAAWLRRTWGVHTLLVLGYIGVINSALVILGGNKMGWFWAWIGFTIIQNGHKASGLRRQLKEASRKTARSKPRFAPAVAALVIVCAFPPCSTHATGTTGSGNVVVRCQHDDLDCSFIPGTHPDDSFLPDANVEGTAGIPGICGTHFRAAGFGNEHTITKYVFLIVDARGLRECNSDEYQKDNGRGHMAMEASMFSAAGFAEPNEQIERLTRELSRAQNVQNSRVRQQNVPQNAVRVDAQTQQALRRANVLNNSRLTTPYIPPTATTPPKAYTPPPPLPTPRQQATLRPTHIHRPPCLIFRRLLHLFAEGGKNRTPI